MSDARDATDRPRVVVVGAGLAGLTAATFTARHDFETVVLTHGESILRRNAQVENFTGFPAGVNSRLLLEMTREQARRSGAMVEDGEVTSVDPVAGDDDGPADGRADVTDDVTDAGTDADAPGGFTVALADGDTLAADYVVAASWSDCSYLSHLDVGLVQRGSKRYVDVDEHGRTGLDGLYAAGRIAETHHQAIVVAGNGATVALALLDDSDVPFYHDWVVPEGYFTERGREVPPGCEEVSEAERRRRERQSLDVMRSYFDAPHDGEPTMHPSVVTKREREEADCGKLNR